MKHDDQLSKNGDSSIKKWVVSNIFYFPFHIFPFHIWAVILPIDFHIFQDGYCTTNPAWYQYNLMLYQ